MMITPSTTVREIVEKNPEAFKIFLEHGVDVKSECDESLWDTELELCESMCHIDNINGLIADLQKLFDSTASG
jgi:hypothetical protein